MGAPETVDGFPAYAPELARQGPGYDPEVFAKLAELEAGNFWFTNRNALITWAIRRHAPAPGSILELGCGTGFVLGALAASFPSAALTGSEIFVEGLRITRARAPRATLIQLDARVIPFVGAYDVVGAFDVLEHIEEDVRVLEQVRNALRPGGIAVIAVPQHRWLWSVADDHAHHVRRYTAAELQGKLEHAGFDVLTSTSYMTLLLPLMLISRLVRSRGINREYDPLAEFRLPSSLNRLFGAVLRIERALIEAGLRLPVGGSRLVVARRSTR